MSFNIVGSLNDQEVACLASDSQDSYIKSCFWRAVLSRHPQEVLPAQFSLDVQKRWPKTPFILFYFASNNSDLICS